MDLLGNSWFWRLCLGLSIWLIVSLFNGQMGLDAIAHSHLSIPNEVQDEIPNEVQDEIPNEVQDEIPDEAQDEIPDEAQDEIPDEAQVDDQNEVQAEDQDENGSTDSGATFIPALSPQYPPPELKWLQPGAVPPDDVITSATISLSGLTPPSLWWTDQQFGGKTLKGWIAYPGTETLPPRVDLVVNRQLWGLSDYLERYRFVHHFGRAAQSFGYTIRVFNDVGDPLAIYPCPINPCAIIINSSGIGVLQDNDPFSTF